MSQHEPSGATDGSLLFLVLIVQIHRKGQDAWDWTQDTNCLDNERSDMYHLPRKIFPRGADIRLLPAPRGRLGATIFPPIGGRMDFYVCYYNRKACYCKGYLAKTDALFRPCWATKWSKFIDKAISKQDNSHHKCTVVAVLFIICLAEAIFVLLQVTRMSAEL